MDEVALLNKLSLPTDTWFRRNLPFNQLAQRLNPKQRKMLEEVIESYGIRILATLTPRNTNILAYEDEQEKYEEIHLYSIKLKEWQKQKEVYRTLATLIPYPIVIFFHQENQQTWVLGEHHRHMDGLRLVADALYQSKPEINSKKYIEAFNFNKLNKTDLKTTYQSLIDSMVNLELNENYQLNLQHVPNIEYLTRLTEIDKQIDSLQKQARKETQMNQRLPLNMQIHQLKKEKEKLIKELEE